MYKITILAFFSILFMACNSGKNDKTAVQQKDESGEEGWITLFDGHPLDSWHQYGQKSFTKRWKIADSVLFVDTSAKSDNMQGDLVSNDEYGNFDLKLEWKISKGGNSGILFYVHEDTTQFKQTFHSGPEMQIVDNEGHPDGKIKKHQAGDLYDMISCSSKMAKSIGEWNETEIRSLNGKLDFYLNGKHVVSTTMWDDNWNKMVAGSKFKAWPGFGTFKRGHIALQDHEDLVWFRNIRIKRL
jgi:3-keto-disaccharide hydrolase